MGLEVNCNQRIASMNTATGSGTSATVGNNGAQCFLSDTPALDTFVSRNPLGTNGILVSDSAAQSSSDKDKELAHQRQMELEDRRAEREEKAEESDFKRMVTLEALKNDKNDKNGDNTVNAAANLLSGLWPLQLLTGGGKGLFG